MKEKTLLKIILILIAIILILTFVSSQIETNNGNFWNIWQKESFTGGS